MISIHDAAAGLTEPWSPVEIARINDAIVRIARLDGAFAWHHHDEDEMFVCWDGEFRIEVAGADAVLLRRGDAFVVPRGVEHRPVADAPAVALLIEHARTKQYGN
jgi:mannose-6-phosphate isomerase-like protein (cupin superfamily)